MGFNFFCHSCNRNKDSCTSFNVNSAAYITTNEDLRSAMHFMPKKCNRALTVAASGDHPLFASLFGAKYVDTFDITFNAKCIMDIKTTALNCMNRDEYTSLLQDLYDLSKEGCVLSGQKIAKKLPIPTEDIDFMNTKSGLCIVGTFDKYRLPMALEYKKLQKIVKKPYKFFHTDIQSLGRELTESYDFIHLSNIFEHMQVSQKQQSKIIISLMEHVNVGGRILFQHLIWKPWKRPPIPEKLCPTHGDTDWRFVQIDMISIIERLR